MMISEQGRLHPKTPQQETGVVERDLSNEQDITESEGEGA